MARHSRISIARRHRVLDIAHIYAERDILRAPRGDEILKVCHVNCYAQRVDVFAEEVVQGQGINASDRADYDFKED
jgi:hypothetical protein